MTRLASQSRGSETTHPISFDIKNIMNKLGKSARKKTIFAFALASIYTSGAIAANNSYSFTVDFSLAAKRTGMNNQAFNSGFDFMNPHMIFFSSTPTSSIYPNNSAMLAQINPGTIRFPHGTRANHYAWDNVQGSYCDDKVDPPQPAPNDCKVSRNQWVYPDQVYKNFASTSLASNKRRQLLLQVNAAEWVCPQLGTGQPCVVSEDGLTLAANRAAAWVDYDRQSAQSATNPHLPTLYWEIGNEDWIFWSPEQYAHVFAKIATAMYAKVEAAGTSLRILAQSQPRAAQQTYPIPRGTRQDNTNWITRFATALRDTEHFDLSKVYGLSEHLYLGSASTDIQTNTGDMLRRVANLDLSGQVDGLKEAIANPYGWKVWVTEFQVQQSLTVLNAIGMQNRADGLVLADFVGKMISMGVERVFMHQLAHDPEWALFQFLNTPATVPDGPVMMPGGLIMSKYANDFASASTGSNLRTISETYSYGSGNSDLGYSPVGAYASHDPVSKTLKLMLVNRDLVNSTVVTINTTNNAIAAPTYSNFTYYATLNETQLSGASLSTSNITTPGAIAWVAKAPAQVARSCPITLSACTVRSTMNNAVTLTPGGVSFVTLTLNQ